MDYAEVNEGKPIKETSSKEWDGFNEILLF